MLLGGRGFRPEPWRPQDSLAFVMLMANDLSFWNGRPEEVHFRWLRELGVARTLDLAGGPRHVPEAILALATAAEEVEHPEDQELGDDERDVEGDGEGGVEGVGDDGSGPAGSPGSNNWALGGGRTASGAPLVANDPHLPFRLPGTWYQALLRAPGYAVAGMTLPGVPGVVIGRNADLAWALTNVMLDDHDLYFEDMETAADGSRRVRRGDGWRAVEVRRETIAIAGGGSEELELLSTDRGPLLPADAARGLPPRSLAWTLYETDGADPMAAFLALGRAATLDAVRAGIGGYVGPAQNLVVGQRDGGLLWTILGRLPVRRGGDGWLPSPGWQARYGWDGLLPAADNPEIRDPADGLLVTANNRIAPADDPRGIQADYDSDHRARRIRQRLTARAGWTVADMAGVQTDVTDLYALDVVAAALAGLPPAAAGAGRRGSRARRRPAARLGRSHAGRSVGGRGGGGGGGRAGRWRGRAAVDRRRGPLRPLRARAAARHLRRRGGGPPPAAVRQPGAPARRAARRDGRRLVRRRLDAAGRSARHGDRRRPRRGVEGGLRPLGRRPRRSGATATSTR